VLRQSVDHSPQGAQALIDARRFPHALTGCPGALLLLAARQINQVDAARERRRHAVKGSAALQGAGEYAVRSTGLSIHAGLADVSVLQTLV
jgi:hypothetical protein